MIVTAGPARADCITPEFGTCESGSPAAFFEMRTDDYLWCDLSLAPGEITTVTVKVFSIPIQKIRFVLPDPPLGTVVDESWGVSSTGDRTTGIEVDLGGCSSMGEVTIGTISVWVEPDESGPCGQWAFDEEVSEVLDCEGMWRPAENSEQFVVTVGPWEGCVCGQSCCAIGLPPYDIYPPDGATEVPLDVVLSWTQEAYFDNPPYGGCYVKISTDPCGETDPITVPCAEDAFAPDFLQPGTTYYWQPGSFEFPTGCNNGVGARAPLHSFTTMGPNPVESHTWGQVKSQYRD